LTGTSFQDYENDVQQGFMQIEVDDIDQWGVEGIAERIMARVGTEIPVYLSIDIDVLDVAFAPATGTPEAGGWSTRELIRILRGIEGLNVVGADLVEVAPAYDGAGEPTSIAAAQIVYEVVTSMVKRGLVVADNSKGDKQHIKDEL
jgi:agmatinase